MSFVKRSLQHIPRFWHNELTMKIALVAPIEETVPPEGYGGTEWIVYHLAHGLGKRGHTVDLYAPGNSKKEDYYTLIPTVEKSIRQDPVFGPNPQMREIAKYKVVSDLIKIFQHTDYDIVHNNAGARLLLFSDLIPQKNRCVTTLHRVFDYQRWVYQKYRDLSYVSISLNQKREIPELHYVGNVYNGISLEDFTFTVEPHSDKGDYIVFLARMNNEKGAIEAAQIAMRLKKHIYIAAKVDLVDQNYFEQFKKVIDPTYVHFTGEISPSQRSELLGNAKLLIAPINWEEPFGLMFTEAMACGTPVVAYSRGSVPEIIQDGVTGFIVNSSSSYIRGDFQTKELGMDGLNHAVVAIYSLSRDNYLQMRIAARQHVEEYFSVDKMIDGYEKVYQDMINHL